MVQYLNRSNLGFVFVSEQRPDKDGKFISERKNEFEILFSSIFLHNWPKIFAEMIMITLLLRTMCLGATR